MKFKFRNLFIPLLALSLAACGNTPAPEEPEEPKEPTIDDYYEEAVKDYIPLAKRDIDSFDRTYTKVTSTGAYVRKVNNIGDQDFIMGVDASSVIVEENSGVKYYDFEGNEADVFKVLSDSGVNYIRVRVWNDPYDSEGHGYGGGNKGVEPAFLYLKPGKKSLDELFAEVGNGVFITDVSGLHAGLNPQSGNFSLQSTGFMIENGKKGKPLDLITVSGNLLEIFQDVLEVGNDTYVSPSGVSAQSLLIKKIAVSGK